MPLSPRLLEDIDVPVKALTPLSSNNTSAIGIAWDPMGHGLSNKTSFDASYMRSQGQNQVVPLAICIQRFSLQISS